MRGAWRQRDKLLKIIYRDAILFFTNPKFRDVALREPRKYLSKFFFSSAMELVKQLIEEHKVAVIPGMTFGMENKCYLRIAYGALQKDTAAEGIGRLVEGLEQILAT